MGMEGERKTFGKNFNKNKHCILPQSLPNDSVASNFVSILVQDSNIFKRCCWVFACSSVRFKKHQHNYILEENTNIADDSDLAKICKTFQHSS